MKSRKLTELCSSWNIDQIQLQQPQPIVQNRQVISASVIKTIVLVTEFLLCFMSIEVGGNARFYKGMCEVEIKFQKHKMMDMYVLIMFHHITWL